MKIVLTPLSFGISFLYISGLHLLLFCWGLLHLCLWWMLVCSVFFCFLVLTFWFWYENDTGFMKWCGKYFIFLKTCRIDVLFFQCLVGFTSKTIWAWRFFFSLRILPKNIISLIVMWLFKLLYQMTFGSLWFLRNWSFHLSCWIYVHSICWLFSCPSLIFSNCVLSLFINLAQSLSFLLIFSKNQILVSFVFSIFLLSVWLISALILTVSFLLLWI